jgi:hypothetical protein
VGLRLSASNRGCPGARRWLNDTTFEVATVGFNEKTWIDRAGTPHSDQLKVTERFRRVSFDQLEMDVIIEDA